MLPLISRETFWKFIFAQETISETAQTHYSNVADWQCYYYIFYRQFPAVITGSSVYYRQYWQLLLGILDITGNAGCFYRQSWLLIPAVLVITSNAGCYHLQFWLLLVHRIGFEFNRRYLSSYALDGWSLLRLILGQIWNHCIL